MTERHVTHDTMLIDRHYRADPGRVYAAWAEPEAKRTWFVGSEEGFALKAYELDFRVGGREFLRGEAGGATYTYDARYDDLVAGERIVYSYVMLRGDVRISVSVTCVEFRAEGQGTHLVVTEHGVYLDGEDKPQYRFEGISGQVDALGRYLEGPA